MRTMSEKTKKFLAALEQYPNASVHSLAKKYKIGAGYAYKLAKKQRGQDIEKLLGPRPKHLPMVPTEVVTVGLNTANKVQVGGEHYKKSIIQPWDYIVSNRLGYLEGNIVKYVSRWKDKGGRQDLEKAKHYLDKLLEVV